MVLCAGAFGCYAAQGSLPGAQGQGYDLNLSYSRTTLKAVADAITQQVGIAFSYETALAGYPMENLEVSEKGATIEAILAAVFTPRGIDYRVVDKVVVLTRSTRPVPAASAAAKSEVKGVVRDAAGNPMIGVTVTIKGTLVGVSTGVDGGYAIPADGNATLLFSYIGYRPHEEVVGRRTQIDVTMQEDELVMDEVVVVGYGTLKKRNIVGAVENLSGDAVENRPNANITRSLQGQIPGLNIVQVDGKADHAGEVTIRGVNNTFKARVSGGEKTNKLGQGGGALVLIDGAEGDMGSVNPDDIASISVLKDASSAAVYGVILITTKDPEKGKVRVSYNGSVSLHRRTVIWEDNVVTDPVQWVDAFRESYLNSSPTATVPSLFNNYMPYSNAWFEELKRRRADPTMDNYDIDANGNYNYYGETNWLKEIYKSVNYSTTHAVSIQGGREGVSYYISGRYYNQDGIYKVGEETYKKYNLRAKGSIRIRPWLTLDNNTSLMSSKYHQPMVHYGQQVISRQIDMFAFPFALLKNPDGTWTQTAAKTGYAAFAEGTSWQENNKLEVANTTTFNFEFVPDVFKVSADVTYKGSRWSRDRMENLYTYYTGVNVSGQDNSYSSLENWTYRSDYISTNIVGTVTPKLGADHDLNVVAGWNLEDYDYRTQKTYRQGNLYPSKPSFTLMDGEYYSTTSGGYTWGLVGFFGRVNYAYAGRYLAEVSARYDGSSKFPSSSQWGFFPSASVGWRLSEEPWLKPHVEGWRPALRRRGRRRHHDQGQPHAVQPRRPGDHRQPVAALPVQHQHVAELERHRAFDAVAGRGQARLVPVDGVRILLGQMEPRLQLADEDTDGRQRGSDRQEHRQLARHEHGQEPLLDTHGIARRQPQRRPADVGERPLPAGRFVHPTEEHHHRLHLPQAHLQEAAPRGAEGLPVGREPLHPLADVQAHGHVRPRSHHQRRLRFRGLDHFGPERYG